MDSLFPCSRKAEGRERLRPLLEPELPMIETKAWESEGEDRGKGKPGGGWGLRIPMARPEELAIYKEEEQAQGVVFSPQL
jgi:hypothetical protein